jgi:hypothetical protein
MDKAKRCNFILLLWAIFSICFLAYLFVNQKDISDNDIAILRKKIDSVALENNKLDSAILVEKNKAVKYQSAIDSLETLEPKIITKYVNKYKEIDSASVGVIIADFDSIFAANGY